ncbi:alpha/beta hydrolase [Ideonella azotifigens]|uniref:Alpha/beta hydrolase n=1 Tax=Ideonella azotifigens TaxID=513160 RepID=A0ABN1KLU2_9BURK|nr:alpha/beta hydrolase [Ideonella azotifigens]MCD2343377.1 alpha/beta hydrolase [Ideonella azotifigens]
MNAPASPSTWVLLRGLTRGAGHWGDFPARLQQALPGAHLLLPELPGNGVRHREPSPTCVPAMTEALRATLQPVLKDGPVHLLALSLGAMVACDWAARHPQELRGAVLINTSLRPFSPLHHRLRPAVPLALLRWLWRLRSARGRALAGPAWEAELMGLTSALAASQPLRARAVLTHWEALRRANPVSAANTLRQLWAAARYRAPLQPPAVPMLVLNGAADRLVNPACSQRLAQAWQLPLEVHSLAGHDLPLDDAAWVAQQVARWAAGDVLR